MSRARRSALRVGAALLIFIAALLLARWWDLAIPSLGRAEFQAVFLANGQTYFGRYSDRLGPYAKIESVHYIQQTPTDDPGRPPDSRLVRRGGELHAPLERVLVPKTAILFVEDLREDSPIAQFMRQRAAVP